METPGKGRLEEFALTLFQRTQSIRVGKTEQKDWVPGGRNMRPKACLYCGRVRSRACRPESWD